MGLDASAVEPEDSNNKFKQLLLRRREEALTTLQANKTNGSAPLGDSSYAYHMADVGTGMMEREKCALFASQSSRVAVSCAEALNRITNGDYGVCGDCGKQISEERLKILPETRVCVRCKKKQEA